MKLTIISRALSLLLCLMLIAATVFIATGCGGAVTGTSESPQTGVSESPQADVSASSQPDVSASSQPEVSEAPVPDASEQETPSATVLGEGETVFQFTVTYRDGTTDSFEIHTDETTVGAALLKLDLIQGEESAYGLYVKTVNGVTADYDADQTYWAFYVNGAYASTGVDSTEVTAGAEYGFKVEK